MPTIQELESRRDTILSEMRSIRSMKRGTVSEQYLKVRHKGKKEPVLRGPYYVFTRSEHRKTVSRRLRTGEEVERARRDVAEYKRFVGLCREFEVLTEKLAELEREGGDLAAEKNGGNRGRAGPGSNLHSGEGRSRAPCRPGGLGNGLAGGGPGRGRGSLGGFAGWDWLRPARDAAGV